MKSIPKTSISLKPTRGFTLVELLVSVLIFAIGLLGLTYLQITGLRTNQMSLMRTQATAEAYSMADRMRANTGGAEDDHYNGAAQAFDTNCMADAEGSDAPCNSQALAQYDRDAWLNALNRLPGGSGEVVDNGSNSYSIIVRWDQDRTGASETGCSAQNPDDLRCYQLDITL